MFSQPLCGLLPDLPPESYVAIASLGTSPFADVLEAMAISISSSRIFIPQTSYYCFFLSFFAIRVCIIEGMLARARVRGSSFRELFIFPTSDYVARRRERAYRCDHTTPVLSQ